MNILILNWRDMKHPLAGGAEISLLEHAKYWHAHGATITWFSSQFRGSKEKELLDGITYIRKGSHFTVHLWFIYFYLLNKFANATVIIDCFHFLPFFTPLYVKEKKIIAFINEIAGNLWFSNLSYIFAFIGYHLERVFFVFYKNQLFITASDSTKNDLLKVGILDKNITIINHGATLGKVSLSVKKEKYPTFMFLGRISSDKGIKDALLAFIEIKHEFKNAKLWIAGREEKAGGLSKLFASLSLSEAKDSITYYGFISEAKKFELLKRSWVLLHTSVKEGWGLTVIEAASQGTPTIGYNVEGLRDSIKNNVTGLLTEKNPESMAAAAYLLIANEKTFAYLSKNAIAWSKKFNWKEAGRKSFKLIGRVNNNQKSDTRKL